MLKGITSPVLDYGFALATVALAMLLTLPLDPHATEEGGNVTIATIAPASAASQRAGAVLEIRDTGTGIRPDLLPKIFDFFVTTKAPGEGTGFGLAICQEIIKAHGGTIDIDRQLGKGTTVRIFLPACEAVSETAAAEAVG